MGCSCSCSWPLLTTLCASAARAFGESQAPRRYLSDAACICISTEFPKSFTSRQLAKQRTNMWLSRSLKTAPRLELSRGGAPTGADAAGAAGAATPSKASAGGAGGRASEPGARTAGGGAAAVRSAPGSAAGSMGGAAAAGAAGTAGASSAVTEVVEVRPTRVPFRCVPTDPQSSVVCCYVCSPAFRILFLAQRLSRRLPWHRSQRPLPWVTCAGGAW